MRKLLALTPALALALAACGGPTSGGTDGGSGNTQSLGLTPQWSSIKTAMPSCALGTACHASTNGTTPTGHVDLDPKVAYANLVGQPSTEQPSLNLVQPGHPELSYLVNKLEGSQAQVCAQNGDPTFDCGVQMPNGGPYLSASDIQAIKTWITNGAQNN